MFFAGVVRGVQGLNTFQVVALSGQRAPVVHGDGGGRYPWPKVVTRTQKFAMLVSSTVGQQGRNRSPKNVEVGESGSQSYNTGEKTHVGEALITFWCHQSGVFFACCESKLGGCKAEFLRARRSNMRGPAATSASLCSRVARHRGRDLSCLTWHSKQLVRLQH